MVQPHDIYNWAGNVAGWGIVWALRRKLPLSVTALVLLISVAIPVAFDHFIGIKPINLYDINVNPGMTFDDFLTWMMYPPFGYLFVYFYDRWRVSGVGISLYILGWALMGVALEALGVYCRVFIYRQWKLYDSLPVYVIIQLLMIILFHILMQHFRKARKE